MDPGPLPGYFNEKVNNKDNKLWAIATNRLVWP
jgi:hypothetical protein